MNLSHKKASKSDLPRLVELLIDDELGSKRDGDFEKNKKSYEDMFDLIDKDPNQYLMVILQEDKIIGTCHLTLVPSLTYKGKIRCQIEALRVCSKMRGKGMGHWVIREAIEWGKKNKAKIFQLTADKRRERVKKFYESLGFVPTHDGYKMNLG
jgi:GNAT superfamily N-acetyltransferase